MLKTAGTVKANELERSAEDALLACLSEVPFLRVEQSRRQAPTDAVRPDLLMKLRLPDGLQTLVCEVKNSGQPRVIRDAINALLRYREFLPNAYGVVVAPYVARAAAEICKREDIGYVDLAGNCRLSFGQVYIQKEGKPNPFAQRRDLRSLYSPRATRVLRVLLSNPDRKWKVQALAEEAKVSIGQSFNVKKLLHDREWIRAELGGFTLTEPWALLDEWSANYAFRRTPKWDLYSLKSAAEVESDLAELCLRERIAYALTGFSGAARVAPFVRYQRATVYIDGDENGILRLASMLDLRRVPSGANVSLWIPYDQGVFYGTQEFGGVRTVSSVQLYLDLRALGGRGEDAAGFLLETVLKPQW